MKREITCYETNKLDTFKFIKMCKYYIHAYNHKTILLPVIAKEIWRMIQQDVFNIPNSEMQFDKLINDIGYIDFIMTMFYMCYTVKQKEEDYIYYINSEDKDCISLIGEPIYKFLNRIEEMLPDED